MNLIDWIDCFYIVLYWVPFESGEWRRKFDMKFLWRSSLCEKNPANSAHFLWTAAASILKRSSVKYEERVTTHMIKIFAIFSRLAENDFAQLFFSFKLIQIDSTVGKLEYLRPFAQAGLFISFVHVVARVPIAELIVGNFIQQRSAVVMRRNAELSSLQQLAAPARDDGVEISARRLFRTIPTMFKWWSEVVCKWRLFKNGEQFGRWWWRRWRWLSIFIITCKKITQMKIIGWWKRCRRMSRRRRWRRRWWAGWLKWVDIVFIAVYFFNMVSIYLWFIEVVIKFTGSSVDQW